MEKSSVGAMKLELLFVIGIFVVVMGVASLSADTVRKDTVKRVTGGAFAATRG